MKQSRINIHSILIGVVVGVILMVPLMSCTAPTDQNFIINCRTHPNDPDCDGLVVTDPRGEPASQLEPQPDSIIYMRGWAGTTLTETYWVGDAALVLPKELLLGAPEEDKMVVLFLMEAFGPLDYHLSRMPAGSSVSLWQKKKDLGQVEFETEGFLVLVELSVLKTLGLLHVTVDSGIVVKLHKTTFLEVMKNHVFIDKTLLQFKDM